jgi:hypothetical protein
MGEAVKNFLATLILLMALPAYSQTWVKINESPEVEFYVDTSSIKRKQSVITYWSMHNKRLAGLVNSSDPNTKSTKYRINQYCADEEYQITYYATYDKPMGEGKILVSETVDMKPKPNIPGTFGFGEMKFICSISRGKNEKNN